MPDTIRDNQGIERVLGCLPRVSKVGDGTFRVFGDGTPPPLPESEWKKYRHINLKSMHWHTIDQARQGSCLACATVGVGMLERELAGLTQVILSQASIYALGNDGRDQGMAVDRGLEILRDIGACPTSVIDQYDWQGYRRNTWPDDWDEQASRYRGIEYWDCQSYEDVVSANCHGFGVVYGCKGHAVIRIGWETDLNSWGPGWGNNGLGRWATRREFEQGIPRYGAWAFRGGTDPTGDGDLPIAE